MEVFKLCVTLVIFVCVIILSRGYFASCDAERKGAVWHPYPKRKPKKSKHDSFDTKRYIISLADDTVLISTYNFKKMEFDMPDVDAWREVPNSFNHFKKQLAFLKRKKKED